MHHVERKRRMAAAVGALAALALAGAAPAQAAPDRSVSAGAVIPSNAFDFVAKANGACTYHVATNGSDSASGASTAPWRTITKALGTLQAGQTACVHAGTYDVGAALDPARSGRADAPITLMGAPGEARPVLRSTSTGTLLGFGAGDAYWVVQGLDLDKNQRTGSTVQVLGSPSAPAHHIAIRNNVIRDGAGAAAVLVRHAATDVLVEGNSIYGQHRWESGANVAYSQVDASYRRKDANGVNVEGTSTAQVARVRVQGNTIHDNGGDGIQCLGVNDDAGASSTDPADIDAVDNRIYQNTENAADIKSCRSVSIRGSKSPELAGSAAGNKFYGYSPTNTSTDAPGNHSNGGAIVIHYFARNVEVRNTRIWNSCSGISIGRDDKNGVQNVVVARTLVFGLVSGTGCPGVGINLILAQHVDLFHNTLTGIPNTAIRLGSDNGGAYASADVDVFNNIIDSAGYWLDLYRYRNKDPQQPRMLGFESDRNLFWNADGSTSHMKLDFDKTSLADWRTKTGQDATSRYGDPLFVDQPTTNDYYTRTGSLARDAALAVTGAAYCGSGPDIGFRESGC